jgi:hypothetical protein
VKSLGRWIIEGLCSSEGILDPREVSEIRKRQLKGDYGMISYNHEGVTNGTMS